MIRMRSAWVLTALIAALAGAFPACGDSESLTETPGTTVEGGTGGSSSADASTQCTIGTSTPACQLCLNARCLSDCKDCQATQNCEPALSCLKTKCPTECGVAEDASAGGSAGQGGQAGQAGDGGLAGNAGQAGGAGKAGEGGAAGKAGNGGGGGKAGSAGKGGSGGSLPDASTSCAINFGIPACNSCLGDKCLDQCNNCAANTECVALLTCIRQCNGDFVCETQCRLKHAGGVGPEELLWGTFGCKKANCQTECSGPPQCGLQTGTTACDTCINSSCFGECDTCANDPECSAIFGCVQKNCTAPYQKWCVGVCALQHPKGDAAMEAFWGSLLTPGCVESKCDSPCIQGGTTTQCSLNTGAIVCDTCVDTQCMTECNTCKANAECQAIYDCVKAQCNYPYQDTICISSCTVQHLGGAQDFLAFWNGITGCIGTKCSLLCQ